MSEAIFAVSAEPVSQDSNAFSCSDPACEERFEKESARNTHFKDYHAMQKSFTHEPTSQKITVSRVAGVFKCPINGCEHDKVYRNASSLAKHSRKCNPNASNNAENDQGEEIVRNENIPVADSVNDQDALSSDLPLQYSQAHQLILCSICNLAIPKVGVLNHLLKYHELSKKRSYRCAIIDWVIDKPECDSFCLEKLSEKPGFFKAFHLFPILDGYHCHMCSEYAAHKIESIKSHFKREHKGIITPEWSSLECKVQMVYVPGYSKKCFPVTQDASDDLIPRSLNAHAIADLLRFECDPNETTTNAREYDVFESRSCFKKNLERFDVVETNALTVLDPEGLWSNIYDLCLLYVNNIQWAISGANVAILKRIDPNLFTRLQQSQSVVSYAKLAAQLVCFTARVNNNDIDGLFCMNAKLPGMSEILSNLLNSFEEWKIDQDDELKTIAALKQLHAFFSAIHFQYFDAYTSTKLDSLLYLFVNCLCVRPDKLITHDSVSAPCSRLKFLLRGTTLLACLDCFSQNFEDAKKKDYIDHLHPELTCSFSFVGDLKSLAFSTLKSPESQRPTILYVPHTDYREFSINGVPMTLEGLRNFVGKLLVKCDVELRNLCKQAGNQFLRIYNNLELNQAQGDHLNHSATGKNWTNTTKYLKDINKQVYGILASKKLCEPLFQKNGDKLDLLKMNRFINKFNSFIKILLTAMHLTGGLPGRTEEIAMTLLTSNNLRPKSLTIDDGRVMLTTGYAKTSNYTGKEPLLVREYPKSLSKVIVGFVVLLRPIECLYYKLTKMETCYDNSNKYLFLQNGETIGADEYIECFAQVLRSSNLSAIRLSDYRKLICQLMSHFFPRLESVCKWQEQAAHSESVHDSVYAKTNLNQEAIPESRALLFRECSRNLHALWNITEDKSFSLVSTNHQNVFNVSLQQSNQKIPHATSLNNRNTIIENTATSLNQCRYNQSLQSASLLSSSEPVLEPHDSFQSQNNAFCTTRSVDVIHLQPSLQNSFGTEMSKILQSLKDFYKDPRANFKSPEQALAIHSAIYSTASDLLCILPTGGGKSLVYLLPAIMLGKCSIVILPTISLMKDVTDKCLQYQVDCAVWNSNAINPTCTPPTVLLVMVEQCATVQFRNDLQFWLQQALIHRIVIDETHLVYFWSSFRKRFTLLHELRKLDYSVPWTFLTATLPKKYFGMLVKDFCLYDPVVIQQSPNNRPNHQYSCVQFENYPDIIKHLTPKLVREQQEMSLEGRIIVFIENTAECQRFHDELDFLKSSFTIYGSMTAEDQCTSLKHWKECDRGILIATSAACLGIDYSHVRKVYIIEPPKDLCMLCQKFGRGGRDGNPTDCILLYTRQSLLQSGKWEIEASVKDFVRGDVCKRSIISREFDNVLRLEGDNILQICCAINSNNLPCDSQSCRLISSDATEYVGPNSQYSAPLALTNPLSLQHHENTMPELPNDKSLWSPEFDEQHEEHTIPFSSPLLLSHMTSNRNTRELYALINVLLPIFNSKYFKDCCFLCKMVTGVEVERHGSGNTGENDSSCCQLINRCLKCLESGHNTSECSFNVKNQQFNSGNRANYMDVPFVGEGGICFKCGIPQGILNTNLHLHSEFGKNCQPVGTNVLTCVLAIWQLPSLLALKKTMIPKEVLKTLDNDFSNYRDWLFPRGEFFTAAMTNHLKLFYKLWVTFYDEDSIQDYPATSKVYNDENSNDFSNIGNVKIISNQSQKRGANLFNSIPSDNGNVSGLIWKRPGHNFECQLLHPFSETFKKVNDGVEFNVQNNASKQTLHVHATNTCNNSDCSFEASDETTNAENVSPTIIKGSSLKRGRPEENSLMQKSSSTSVNVQNHVVQNENKSKFQKMRNLEPAW